jgi:hypothetical protein
MDVSELRKRILHALDAARRDASARREVRGEAEKRWETFLSSVAVPVFRQAMDVLKAERQLFSVHTPAGSVRLVSDGSPETFLELVLDLTGAEPQMLGRVSRSLGKGRQHVEEQPVAPGKPMSEIDENDLAAYLVAAVPKLVVRT